jgi:UMF1 family MFS transporter
MVAGVCCSTFPPGSGAFAAFIRTTAHFLILAVGVAAVQGGTQALSRSLFATLIPADRSTEFFSLFALSEKVAGFLGPAAFVVTVAVTGSSRVGIISVVLFFITGGIILLGVDVDAGRADAFGKNSPPCDGPRAPGAPAIHITRMKGLRP